jgi:hypothetical protein
MVMARGLSVIVALLTLAGCGMAPSSAPASTSSNAPAARLADSDNGHSVSVALGDRLEVSLQQAAGYAPWQQPVSSDTSVLEPLPIPGGAQQSGITVFAFKALRAGRADLTSFSAFACTPGTYCPALAQTWRVTVKVG